jgi:hypothetical protein
LAQTIREARLTTFESDPLARRLQLLQIQLNFPILFLAALMLDRKLTAAKISNALMSSRDCFLWHHLQQRIRLMSGATYNVIYFFTSRLTGAHPSASYLQYFNQFLSEPSCIVDVSGTGRSMKALISRSANPRTPLFMIAKAYENRDPRPWSKDIEESKLTVLVSCKFHHALERANFARHPMVRDVVALMDSYLPVLFNPVELPWEAVPEIRTQHEAFFHAMNCMGRNDFSKDLQLSDEAIVERLSWFYERMIIFEDWVNHWCSYFEAAENFLTAALREQQREDFVAPWMPLSSAAPGNPTESASPANSQSVVF